MARPNPFLNVVRACRVCGQELLLRYRRDLDRKHYCSRACGARGIKDANLRLVKPEEKSCAQCGAGFIARNRRSLYCGRLCSKKATYAKSLQRIVTPEGFFRKAIRANHRPHLDAAFLIRMFAAQGGRCAITGIPMTMVRGDLNRMNASIDRIDSKVGYRRDNVQLVCLAVNLMKLDMSMDDFRGWCQAVMEAGDATEIRKSA